jgi:hypothetical protein
MNQGPICPGAVVSLSTRTRAASHHLDMRRPEITVKSEIPGASAHSNNVARVSHTMMGLGPPEAGPRLV